MAAEDSNVLNTPDSQALNVIADKVNGLNSLKAAEEATRLLKTKRDELMLEELAPQTSAPAPPPAPAPKYPRATVVGCADCPFNKDVELAEDGVFVFCHALNKSTKLLGSIGESCPLEKSGAVLIALRK